MEAVLLNVLSRRVAGVCVVAALALAVFGQPAWGQGLTLAYLGPPAASPLPVGTDCSNPSSPATNVDWHFQLRGAAPGDSPYRLDELVAGGTWVVPPCDASGHWPMRTASASAPDGTVTWDLYVEHWPDADPLIGGIFQVTMSWGGTARATVGSSFDEPALLFSGPGDFGVGTVCTSPGSGGTSLDWSFRVIGVPTGYEPIQLEGLNGGGVWTRYCGSGGNWPLVVESRGGGVWYLYVEHYPNDLPDRDRAYEVLLQNPSTQDIIRVRAANNTACSKLGAQTIGTTAEFVSFSRSCPQVAKWVFAGGIDFNALYDFKMACPFSRTLIRVYRSSGYVATGAELWSILYSGLDSASAEQQALVDYVEADNECDAGHCYHSPTEAADYTSFISSFITAADQRGFRPVILNIPVGNPGGDLSCPSGDAMQTFAQLVPAIQAAGAANGGWGYHGYTPTWSQDAGYQWYYALRYRAYLSCFPAIADVPLFLTEAGFDTGGCPDTCGWSTNGTEAQYLSWLAWFQNELAADSAVVSASTFAFASPGNWESFRLDPIWPSYAARVVACP